MKLGPLLSLMTTASCRSEQAPPRGPLCNWPGEQAVTLGRGTHWFARLCGDFPAWSEPQRLPCMVISLLYEIYEASSLAFSLLACVVSLSALSPPPLPRPPLSASPERGESQNICTGGACRTISTGGLRLWVETPGQPEKSKVRAGAHIPKLLASKNRAHIGRTPGNRSGGTDGRRTGELDGQCLSQEAGDSCCLCSGIAGPLRQGPAISLASQQGCRGFFLKLCSVCLCACDPGVPLKFRTNIHRKVTKQETSELLSHLQGCGF